MDKWLLAIIIFLGASLQAAEAATVSIDSVSVFPGEEYKTYIEIKEVSNLGAADIDLLYDPGIVHVAKVEVGSFDYTASNVDNNTGLAKIVAFQVGSPGLNGNIKLASVTLKAVGRGSSRLDLGVVTLKTTGNEPIQFALKNGTFTISGKAGEVAKEEPKATPRATSNATDMLAQKSKISQEVTSEMEKAPDKIMQIIIQSVSGTTQLEIDQVVQAGAQILNIRQNMIVARATPEQIKKIAGYAWVSLIGLDVRGEAQETPAGTETPEKAPKAPFVTAATLILALLLLSIRIRRQRI